MYWSLIGVKTKVTVQRNPSFNFQFHVGSLGIYILPRGEKKLRYDQAAENDVVDALVDLNPDSQTRGPQMSGIRVTQQLYHWINKIAYTTNPKHITSWLDLLRKLFAIFKRSRFSERKYV